MMSFSPASEREPRRASLVVTRALIAVEQRLEGLLPRPDREPGTLHRAMRHAVLGGGKRIRPRLVLAVAVACAASAEGLESAIRAACAVELVHAASLVHDDLPSFDDAAERRGAPTVHKRFGESMAILTGDALLALAFETLAGASEAPASIVLEMVYRLARATGSREGIIGGQALEGAAEVGPELLERYHACKTAALFRFAAEAGALAGGADPRAWGDVGRTLGLCYQAADDLLDACGRAAEAGKPVQRDSALGRPNLVSRDGAPAAQSRFEALLTRAERRVRGLVADPQAALALLAEMRSGVRALLPEPRRAAEEIALKSA